MKAHERHKLKENAFATNTGLVFQHVTENRDKWVAGAIALAVLVIALGGYGYWRKQRSESGGTELGLALAIEQATIAPAPTLPGATQAEGTYPTEQARNEAAVKAFQQIADKYGSSNVGVTARYHLGVAQMSLGRFAEAQQTFEKTAADAGSSVYGPMSKMGRAEALLYAGKYDEAIKAFTELSGDRDGILPVDGVLMQLARSFEKAGKTQEARAAFKRIVDEFPDSPYAQEAQKQITGAS